MLVARDADIVRRTRAESPPRAGLIERQHALDRRREDAAAIGVERAIERLLNRGAAVARFSPAARGVQNERTGHDRRGWGRKSAGHSSSFRSPPSLQTRAAVRS